MRKFRWLAPTVGLLAALGACGGGGAADDGEPPRDAGIGDPDATDPLAGCGDGTIEFPFGSGTCIADPCQPDPCGGTGSCSNLTGAAVCTACTHFVDPVAGDDGRAGTSPATAWRSLTPLASAALGPGDNVCIARGTEIAGPLVLPASGAPAAPLQVASYGDGAAPVVSGLTTLTDFTNLGGGVWSAPCPTCGDAVSVVVLDGERVAMGRTPNADAPDGGYLTYEDVIGPDFADPGTGYYNTPYDGPTAIIDTDLPAAPDWTGAELVIRKIHYVIERHRVTSQEGGVLSYPNPHAAGNYTGVPGWGYFIQDDPRTLDQVGEWYFDRAGKTLQIFLGDAGPAGHRVQASTAPHLVSIVGQHDVVLDGLDLAGADGDVVHIDSASGVTVRGSRLRHAGLDGVNVAASSAIRIEGNQVRDSGNNGLFIRNTPDLTVTANRIAHSGDVPGTGRALLSGTSSTGVYVAGNPAVDLHAVIDANIIDDSGYAAVHFVASGVAVTNNVLRRFTRTKTDGGGIYTWSPDGVAFTDRTIAGNVLLDGVGAPWGNPGGTQLAACIYLDNASANLTVTGNTAARCGNRGLMLNYAHDLTVTGNTFFDSATEQVLMNSPAFAPIHDLTMTGNAVVARGLPQLVMEINASAPAGTLGTFDANAYVRPTEDDFIIHTYGPGIPGRFFALGTWQAEYGQDLATTATPVVLRPYRVVGDPGPNLVLNGGFEAGIGQTFTWGPTHTASWDQAGRLDGAGALALSFAEPTGQYAFVYFGVGPSDATKSYLLRVSTFGTTPGGRMFGNLRESAGNLSPPQNRSFGVGRADHEFVIVAPTAAPAAMYQVGVRDTSGTTYLDGIELREVTTQPVDPDASIRFEVNLHTVPMTVALDGAYVDAFGVPHAGELTLAPLTSAVLLRVP